MNTVFWILWSIDLLLTFMVIFAGIVRENMGAFNNENFTYGVILLLVLLGSIVLRYVLRWPLLSVGVVAFPLFLLLFFYLKDTYLNKLP
jgi:hypothetical protein